MRSSIDSHNLNNVFLSATSHDSYDECQKKRKLTNDSGYGDDERMEGILQNNLNEQSSFTRTSSLDDISENNFSARSSIENETSLQEMSERFETSLNCASSIDAIDSCSPEHDNGMTMGVGKTKEKRRRMTPVPGGVSVFKPSKSKLL